MKCLWIDGCFKLSVLFLYIVSGCVFKFCFFNVRFLYRYIDDVCKDLNYLNIDFNLFLEIRFFYLDNENMYKINGYVLFRNDS